MEKIHNTKFYSIPARNGIFQTCDTIKDSLQEKYSTHLKDSASVFEYGLVMKLQYRINRSTQKTEQSKRHKGGSILIILTSHVLQIK